MRIGAETLRPPHGSRHFFLASAAGAAAPAAAASFLGFLPAATLMLATFGRPSGGVLAIREALGRGQLGDALVAGENIAVLVERTGLGLEAGVDAHVVLAFF